jgi:predicted HTH transcriptional regulator
MIRFDEQIVPNAPLSALSPELIRRYRTERSDLNDEVYLRKLAVIGEDLDGVLRPTVCGVLMGTAHPEQYLPHAFIQAVAYHGKYEVTPQQLEAYQIDRQDITGPLDAQVHAALQFVARNMRVAGTKSLGRTDLPQYDLTAVFEALVNAVAHRDYSIHASKIRLRMYRDCLRLYVPGALSNSMEVASLPLRQSTRNEAISSLLARTRADIPISGFQGSRDYLMDKRGEGVTLILARSERLSGKRPVYELIDECELVLTIFAAELLPVQGCDQDFS